MPIRGGKMSRVHSKHREVKEKTGRDKNLSASERVCCLVV